MPVYDYDCAACGRRFEVVHGVHAEGPRTCPLCGKGPVRKAISAAAVHYKGSGWAKKERRTTASSNSSKPTADVGSASDGNAKSDDSSSTDPGRKVEASPASEGKASGSASAATSKTAESGAAKPTD
jgi:putative FmdB family regulatory protein